MLDTFCTMKYNRYEISEYTYNNCLLKNNNKEEM